MRDVLAVLEGLGLDQQRVELDLLLQGARDQQRVELLVALARRLVGLQQHGHLRQREVDVHLVDLVVQRAHFQLLRQEPPRIEHLFLLLYVYLHVAPLERVFHEVVDHVVRVVHLRQLLLLAEQR